MENMKLTFRLFCNGVPLTIMRWAQGISSKLLALCVLGFFMRCPWDINRSIKLKVIYMQEKKVLTQIDYVVSCTFQIKKSSFPYLKQATKNFRSIIWCFQCMWVQECEHSIETSKEIDWMKHQGVKIFKHTN